MGFFATKTQRGFWLIERKALQGRTIATQHAKSWSSAESDSLLVGEPLVEPRCQRSLLMSQVPHR